MGIDLLRMVVFSDSSFANTPSLSTQLGYIIVLTDKNGTANVLHYASYRSKRIVRSVLGGETHAFADSFDMAYTMRNYLNRIFERYIAMTMLTDSLSLFKVLINSSVMTEEKLMIDLAAAREAYERKNINHI